MPQQWICILVERTRSQTLLLKWQPCQSTLASCHKDHLQTGSCYHRGELWCTVSASRQAQDFFFALQYTAVEHSHVLLSKGRYSIYQKIVKYLFLKGVRGLESAERGRRGRERGTGLICELRKTQDLGHVLFVAAPVGFVLSAARPCECLGTRQLLAHLK